MSTFEEINAMAARVDAGELAIVDAVVLALELRPWDGEAVLALAVHDSRSDEVRVAAEPWRAVVEAGKRSPADWRSEHGGGWRRWDEPQVMEDERTRALIRDGNEGGPGPELSRWGLDSRGREVWLHGPERLGQRGGWRWAIRTRNRRCQDDAWTGGCGLYKTPAAAEASFRRIVGEP